MGNEIYRGEVLGESVRSYSFDKSFRGYNPKQVDEFISSLVATNKSASELFDARYGEIRNENSMLAFELQQAKDELEALKKQYAAGKTESDKPLEAEVQEPIAPPAADANLIKVLKDKLRKAVAKIRSLQSENSKLAKKNNEYQSDVAYLTAKIEKYKAKIQDLNAQLEADTTDKEKKKYYAMLQIFEDTIEKSEELVHQLQNEFSLAQAKAADAGVLEAAAQAPQEPSLPEKKADEMPAEAEEAAAVAEAEENGEAALPEKAADEMPAEAEEPAAVAETEENEEDMLQEEASEMPAEAEEEAAAEAEEHAESDEEEAELLPAMTGTAGATVTTSFSKKKEEKKKSSGSTIISIKEKLNRQPFKE